MKVKAFYGIIGIGLLTLLFVVGCTKNPIFYSQPNTIRTDGWENSKVHFAGRTRVLPGKFTAIGYTTDELWGGFARVRVEN